MVDPARETDGGCRVGKQIGAVDVDARRAKKSVLLGGFGAIDDLVVNGEVRHLAGEGAEVAVSLLPAGAVLEVQQRHVHELRVLRPTQPLRPRFF